jgi:DNA-binding response OmpR family regulator
MSAQVILMVGQPPEWAADLAGLINQEPFVDILPVESLADARQFLDVILPDLVLVYADGLMPASEESADSSVDNDDTDLNAVVSFCQWVRQSQQSSSNQQGNNHRSILMVQSEAANEDDRLRLMIEGADDILNQQMSVEELRVRILVQIRRNLEMLAHPITRLPNLDIANRVLQRWMNLYTIEPERTWSLGLIRIDHMDIYREVYGEQATGQVLQSLTQLLAQLVHPPDFLGHATETNTLVMITPAAKTESVARKLCQEFEAHAPEFYSSADRQRGYLIAQDEYRVSHRVPLMSLSIGMVNHAGQQYKTYKHAFSEAYHLLSLASRSLGNTWVSETAKLTSGQSQPVERTDSKTGLPTPQVLVIEPDDALAFLLQSTLEMQGYEVTRAMDSKGALHAQQHQPANLILMDVLLDDDTSGNSGWQCCQALKAINADTHIVVMATVHDRHKAMAAGADIYLPKPFELIALLNTVEQVLKG